MHIGVAGLGAMGGNLAARLMEVGHQVTVWNRSPEKTKPLADAGAKVAATPAAVAAASEAAITMLTDAGHKSGDLAAGVRQRLGLFRRAIPDGHLVADFHQPRGDVAAHGAETGYSDMHGCSLYAFAGTIGDRGAA